jgi:predicted MFS family arabinose efflux permease
MTQTSEATEGPARPPRLTGRHWLWLAVLAAVQLTHILDFIIVMPLQPEFAASLGIGTREFGLMVSVYGLSASLSGMLLAALLDRFDRKTALLGLYGGFTAATLLCGLAPTFGLLVAARALAGAFGGVVAASVLAIVGDAFPVQRRGTATGVVMSAFSLASVAGVPAGLYLANVSGFGWRAPFAVLGVLAVGVLVLGGRVLPSLRGHLTAEPSRQPVRLGEVLGDPGHLRAYALTLALVLGTFCVVPYLAAYLVKNVGRDKGELPLVYLCGGAATLLTMNLVGRLADRFDKLLVFRATALLTAATTLWLTNLPPGASLATVLAATTLFMVSSSARLVPAVALMTGCAAPRRRGSFMSVNTAVQQMAAGLAPLLGGLLLKEEGPREPLTDFAAVGGVAVTATLASVVLAGLLRPAAEAPVLAEVEAVQASGPAEPLKMTR